MLQQEYIPLVNHSHKQANLDDKAFKAVKHRHLNYSKTPDTHKKCQLRQQTA